MPSTFQSETTSSRFGWVWPKITDVRSAKEACRYGFGASLFVAGVTTLVAGISMFSRSAVMGIDSSAFLDAGAFLVVAWGIHRSSRIAAVSGLVLYLFERVVMWATLGPHNPFTEIPLTLCFINALRGTFAYHRFIQEQNAEFFLDATGRN
jgi:hypothetical protein